MMIHRSLGAAVMAFGLAIGAEAIAQDAKPEPPRAEEKAQQEPQGVSLGALVAREFDPLAASPASSTFTSEERVEGLVNNYKLSAGDVRLRHAAALTRLVESAGRHRVKLHPTIAVADVVRESADEIFAGLHTAMGYAQATSVGIAEWDQVINYFSSAGEPFTLFRSKNKDRLRVQLRVLDRVHEEIFYFDDKGKLYRKEQAIVGEGKTLAGLDDLADQVTKTNEGKLALLHPGSSYLSPKSWGVDALNSFLGKAGVKEKAVEGSNVRVRYGVVKEGSDPDKLFFSIDGKLYVAENYDRKKWEPRHFEVFFKQEALYAKALHDRNWKEAERLGKKKDFLGNPYGPESATIDVYKKETAFRDNDAALIRDLARQGKLSDGDVLAYIKGDKGKQVYVMLGLMWTQDGVKNLEDSGISNEKSYNARFNLHDAFTTGKVTLEQAKECLKRLSTKRKPVSLDDSRGLDDHFVLFSRDGKAVDELFGSGLVEKLDRVTGTYVPAGKFWEPSDRLDPYRAGLVQNLAVLGQPIIVQEKKEK